MTNKEAQLALANLKRYISGGGAVDRGTNKAIDMAIEALSKPEIVRCKDCDWWTKQEDSLQGRCALLQMYPTGGWFCGNARRREVTT